MSDEKREWLVPYRRVCCGTASVEAVTADEAVAMVNAGNFEVGVGEETVDWGATGPARMAE